MAHRYTELVRTPQGMYPGLCGGKKNIKPLDKMLQGLKGQLFQDHFRILLKADGKSPRRINFEKAHLPRS